MKKTLLLSVVLTLAMIASSADALSCTTEYDPVCGANGKTYTNECLLLAETRPDRDPIPVAYRGECEEPVYCTQQYDPVCGVDGVTYTNECVAIEVKNVQIAYRGECQQRPTNIPQGCIRWYDGCNECGVQNGHITYCTERYCIHQDTPKCLEYANTSSYQYLTPYGQQRIDYVFGQFLSRLSPYNSYDVLQSLHARISYLARQKEEQIQVVRMTQGAYTQAMFTLEIYTYLLESIQNVLQ